MADATPPFIGVTGVRRRWDNADRTGVNAAYVRTVAAAGGVPLVLSPLLDAALAGPILDRLDGLLLTGGEDVDPGRYGELPHPKLGAVDPARDAIELALFRHATARGMPVLAICRGIQLVNVALGGTLWQDLPSEYPSAIGHDQAGDRAARTHRVDIEPGSLLHQALGVTSLQANSFHHQAVREVPPGLRVSARAPDGLIEAVESLPGTPWMLAVQWHPEEFHAEAAPPERGLFAAFIRQARISGDTLRERALARSSR